jgi:hypothetical protein
MNLENIMSPPDNSIRSNNNLHKNGIQVKNHLGLPVKAQGYDISTTNATTTGTNGTNSG